LQNHPELKARVVRDRGSISVEVAPPFRDDAWSDLDLVRSMLSGNDELEDASVTDLARFLDEHYARIAGLPALGDSERPAGAAGSD
jgi:hypothetical protein